MTTSEPEIIGDAADANAAEKQSNDDTPPHTIDDGNKVVQDEPRVSALNKNKTIKAPMINTGKSKPKEITNNKNPYAGKIKDAPAANLKKSKQFPQPAQKPKLAKTKEVPAVQRKMTVFQKRNSQRARESAENEEMKRESLLKAAVARRTTTFQRMKSVYGRKTIRMGSTLAPNPSAEDMQVVLEVSQEDNYNDEDEFIETEENEEEEEVAGVAKRKKRKTRRKTTAYHKKKSISARKTLKRGKLKDTPERVSLDLEKELEEEESVDDFNFEFEEEALDEHDPMDDYVFHYLEDEDVSVLSFDVDVSSESSVESVKEEVVHIVRPQYYHISHNIHSKVQRRYDRYLRDFFDRLGHVPDVDEISLTGSMKRQLAIERGEIPLSRSARAARAAAAAAAAALAAKPRTPPPESEESSEWSSSSTEYSDIDYNFESSEEEVIEMKVKFEEKEVDDDNLFDLFMTCDEKPAIIYAPPLDENYERLQQARRLRQDTHTFLRSLLDAVVEVADNADRLAVLRSKLDKVQLYRKIDELMTETHNQWKINDFLNNKCVIHFRRIRSYTQITPDKDENLSIVIKKYNQIVEDLDCLLGKHAADKTTINKHVNEAEVTIANLKEHLKDLTGRLETLLRRTFHERKSAALNGYIERSIKEMSAIREEISLARCMLIQRQHTNGLLAGQIELHENISEKFKMSDYVRMLDQEFSTLRKIIDKTDRLDKLRAHFYAINNIIAHIRDKQALEFNSVHALQEDLAAAEEEQTNLRIYNHKLKLRRIYISKNIQDHTLNNGLLSKPGLMADYDRSVEQIEAMKQKIIEMKSKIERMETVIETLQARKMRQKKKKKSNEDENKSQP